MKQLILKPVLPQYVGGFSRKKLQCVALQRSDRLRAEFQMKFQHNNIIMIVACLFYWMRLAATIKMQ